VDPRHAVLARVHVEQPDAGRAARGDQQHVGGIAAQYIVCLAVEFPAASGLPGLAGYLAAVPVSGPGGPGQGGGGGPGAPVAFGNREPGHADLAA